MLPVTHLMAGVGVYATAVWTGIVPADPGFLLLGVGVALLPDIDAVTASSLASHHRSPLHAPLVWSLVSIVAVLLHPGAGLLTFLEAMVHLTGDWVAGRTTGVPLAYPFSTTEYSLFQIRPEEGAFSLRAVDRETLSSYLSFYVENRALVLFEACIVFGGVLALLSLL